MVIYVNSLDSPLESLFMRTDIRDIIIESKEEKIGVGIWDFVEK
jgi:hypothetical protein